MSKQRGFDYHELTNFGRNLLTESKEVELKVIIRKMVRKFLDNAKLFTPVVTGNMRKHWDIDNVSFTVKKVKNGYSVTLYNKARNKYGYEYARDVDRGHQSYNQYGGPYVVKHSKYGLNGGAVIGRFIIDNAMKKTTFEIERTVALELQMWLDRCVKNAK